MTSSLLLCLVLQCTLMANLVTSAPSIQEIIQKGEVNIRNETLEVIKGIIEEEVLYNVLQPATCPALAAASCDAIAELDAGYKSGYYWVRGESGPTGVYCDLTGSRFGQKGGWMRVAAVDLSNSSTSYCAPGLKFVTEPTKACAAQSAQSCPSKVLPVHGIEYSKVCGRLLAHQVGTTDAFLPYLTDEDNIDGVYFDGVSITCGNPRKHIWSFAGADSSSKCPCYHNVNGVTPSPFVGTDYFCESGATSLWDGKGCSSFDMCCRKGGPWFCKNLPEPTTDDIELRICATGSDEKFYIEEIEMYVQ